MKYDDLVEHIGEFGPYQRRVYFLSCLTAIAAAVQTLIPVFILAVPDHRCAIPGLENDTYTTQGDRHSGLINHTLPRSPNPSDGQWGDAECHILFNRSSTDSDASMESDSTYNDTESCDRWVYDKSVFENTLASQANMVCDDAVFPTHANMIYMAGLLVGSISFGFFADLKGRKLAIFLAVALHTLTSVFVIFSPNFAVFVIFRFFTGISNMGMYLCAFVLGMELVGRKWRTVAGVAISFFWCTGMFFLNGLAYGIRDWKKLQLASSCYTVGYLFFWWFIPESPRWLINKGRIEEARAILQKVAKSNKKEIPKNAFHVDEKEKEQPKGKITDIFIHPVLAFRVFVVFLNWLVVTMVYYGLTLSVGSLGGSIYMNFFINAVGETLGNIATLLALPRFGRKRFHCFSMLLGAIACLCCMIPALVGNTAPSWVVIVLSNIGKFGATGGFSTIYVFSAELFPTSLRNTVIGSCSMIARIGGMISPYIADLGLLVKGEFGTALPYLVFGASGLVAGVLALTLPETLNMTLPETIQDAIDFGKTKELEETVDAPQTKRDDSDVTKLETNGAIKQIYELQKTSEQGKVGKDNKGFEAEKILSKMTSPK